VIALTVIAVILGIAAIGYLLFALVNPERF